MKPVNFDFYLPTIFFSIVGIFIPGVNAIGLIGLQMLLSKLGIECVSAWTIIWVITISLAIILPFLFFFQIKVLTPDKQQSFMIYLLLFNFFEYISIQASLASLFTSGKTLCYVSDGQNGLEFAFTGWLAIPFLLILSFIYSKRFKNINKVTPM